MAFPTDERQVSDISLDIGIPDSTLHEISHKLNKEPKTAKHNKKYDNADSILVILNHL